MGTYHTYSCNKCKKHIELGGPEEFRKNWRGKRVPEPHVGGKRVNGLWIVLWCPKCDAVEKKVMIEFSKTCSPIEVWGRRAPIKPEYQHDDPERYKCKTCDTLMLDQIPPDAKCKCGGIYSSSGRINT
jgi:hypothetical protein